MQVCIFLSTKVLHGSSLGWHCFMWLNRVSLIGRFEYNLLAYIRINHSEHAAISLKKLLNLLCSDQVFNTCWVIMTILWIHCHAKTSTTHDKWGDIISRTTSFFVLYQFVFEFSLKPGIYYLFEESEKNPLSSRWSYCKFVHKTIFIFEMQDLFTERFSSNQFKITALFLFNNVALFRYSCKPKPVCT